MRIRMYELMNVGYRPYTYVHMYGVYVYMYVYTLVVRLFHPRLFL